MMPTPDELREYADWDKKYCLWTAACARACARILDIKSDPVETEGWDYDEGVDTCQYIICQELEKANE